MIHTYGKRTYYSVVHKTTYGCSWRVVSDQELEKVAEQLGVEPGQEDLIRDFLEKPARKIFLPLRSQKHGVIVVANMSHARWI